MVIFDLSSFNMPLKNKLLLLTTLLFQSMLGQTLPKGFVFLENEIPHLKTELGYASSNNFTGRVIKGYKKGQKTIGTEALALALKQVQENLKPLGLGLKIFDAYRPQRAVNDFINWSKQPKDTLTKSIYYPKLAKDRLFDLGYIASRSGHSRGSTVDLTLIYLEGEKKGVVLDMGGVWDFFSIQSNYYYEGVSKKQKSNRKLLRETMKIAGFLPYDEEWWHFTLKEEPFPNLYFDFIVN